MARAIEEIIRQTKYGMLPLPPALQETDTGFVALLNDVTMMKYAGIASDPRDCFQLVIGSEEEADDDRIGADEDEDIDFLCPVNDDDCTELRHRLEQYNNNNELDLRIVYIPEGWINGFYARRYDHIALITEEAIRQDDIIAMRSEGRAYNPGVRIIRSREILRAIRNFYDKSTVFMRQDVHEYYMGYLASQLRTSHICKTIDYMWNENGSVILSERLDRSIATVMRTSSLSEVFIYMFQILFAVMMMQETYAMSHDDLHEGNIMAIRTPPDVRFFRYELFGTTLVFPATPFILKILDFGYACKWSEPQIISLEVIRGLKGTANTYVPHADIFRVFKTFYSIYFKDLDHEMFDDNAMEMIAFYFQIHQQNGIDLRGNQKAVMLNANWRRIVYADPTVMAIFVEFFSQITTVPLPPNVVPYIMNTNSEDFDDIKQNNAYKTYITNTTFAQLLQFRPLRELLLFWQRWTVPVATSDERLMGIIE